MQLFNNKIVLIRIHSYALHMLYLAFSCGLLYMYIYIAICIILAHVIIHSICISARTHALQLYTYSYEVTASNFKELHAATIVCRKYMHKAQSYQQY